MELFPGKTSIIILENQKRPSLTIHKSDADTDAPVAGAVFTVKAADGNTINEVTTGPDGTATLEKLLPIVYEVTEKSVPEPCPQPAYCLWQIGILLMDATHFALLNLRAPYQEIFATILK